MEDLEKIPLTKEAIASRMFKNAARQWGRADTGVDNFDPLVRMLIEACAVEMFRLSNLVESVQERMIEKLARILTPQAYVLPKPAHCILHGKPVEPECYLRRSMQFFYQKRIASKYKGPLDANLDLYYSPAGDYKVVDGDVKMIVSANNIYNVNENNFFKELVSKTSRSLPHRDVWVGIDVHNKVESLANLSFFFDLKNTPAKDEYTPLFHFTEGYFNGVPINFERGIYNTATLSQEFSFQNSLEELYINSRIEHFVNLYYQQNFITATEQNEEFATHFQSMKQKYPPEFEQIFNQRELAFFSKNLIWVKFRFRPEFTSEAIDDLTIAINCYPVLNRHLNEITYKLQTFFNIIPLLSPEQFLSIHKVESSSAMAKGDKEYKFYTFDQFDKSEKGTYTVRTGELERFDNRNAVEYLNYLVELLRDESRAFAAIGQDFLASTIKALNQNISLIEQRIKQNTTLLNHSPAYLLVNPITDGDTIFAQFWSCNGEQGNGIRSGSKMDQYDSAELVKESITLITPTAGGADKLKNTETLAAYKNVMLSRGRIVTEEDIKNYCRYYLQNKIDFDSIYVQKGIAVSTQPKEGLVPTLDVIIKMSESQKEIAEHDVVRRGLQINLEEQSAIGHNYRVILN